MKVLVPFVVVAVLASGCAGSDEPRPPSGPDVNASGVWELASGRAPAGPIEVPEDVHVTFEVDGANARGSAGCNSYGGGIRIDGDAFDAGSFAVSEIGCPGPVAEVEERYLDAMETADTIAVEGRTLTLTGPDTELVFRRVPPVDTEPLVQTAWVLESLTEGATASSARPARLRFAGDGTFEGTTGCRSFSGSWIVSGDVVTATAITFEGNCPRRATEQDSHVVVVLGAGFRPELEGDRLTLTAVRGGLGLVYRAQ